MTRGLLLPFLIAGSVLVAEEAAPPPAPPAPKPAPPQLRTLIDSLDQAALQEAFRLLTNDYIQQKNLDSLEINRAALQGLLERLDFGAMLLTEQTKADRDSPYVFQKALIHDTLGYIRFGRFAESEIAAFDGALKELQANAAVTHLILDLRSPQSQAEFSIAARLLSRFRPASELLFKIRRPGNDRPTLFMSSPEVEAPTCHLEPVLLVDRDTGNVGEIIAAVLKRRTGCLVVGDQTQGLAVEYRDVPIGEDRILRYAIAEVVLDDDSSIFREGVVPDLRTPTTQKVKYEIYKEVDGGRPLVDFLVQKQRPRMNEAALVARTDPEMDYYLLLSQQKPTPWDRPALQDRALQQTVDLLDTTRFLKSEPTKAR